MCAPMARISGSKATPLEDLGCLKRGIFYNLFRRSGRLDRQA